MPLTIRRTIIATFLLSSLGFAPSSFAQGWSDRDGQEAVAALVNKSLNASWLAQWTQKLGHAPLIVVGRIRNHSRFHIDTNKLARAFAASLARSKKVSVAMAADPRATQQKHCPNLMLTGAIFSTVTTDDRNTLQAFRLFLSLTHIVSAERVWVDDFLRRKLVRGTAKGPRTVERLGPTKRIDLSPHLTDGDIDDLARAAIKDLHARPAARRKPRHLVRLYPLRNRTSEQVGVQLIRSALERELLRKGRFGVLAPLDDASALRALRLRMVRRVDGACPAAPGQELDASLVLSGHIVSLSEMQKRKLFKRYVLTLEAIDPSNHRKVWLHNGKIDLHAKRPTPRW